MVAGRRFWGENEERAAQHQARGGGDLGIEAVVEDRLGAGKARRLDTHVKSGRQVDKKDDGEADQAEHEDDSSQAAPAFTAHRQKGEQGREQRDRNQQERVCLSGGLPVHRRGTCPDQPCVARLAHLYRTVIDELRGDQTGGSGKDGDADRPLRGEHGAGPDRAAPRPAGCSQ